MHRTFLDPKLAWYQGMPNAIPGLVCLLTQGEQTNRFKVSRMDRDGAFIFSGEKEFSLSNLLSAVAKTEQFKTSFEFSHSKVTCVARPVLLTERGFGMGIQFVELSADLKKEVGDFVEKLRGGGYV